MTIKTLHIATIHNGATLVAEYDDATLRVRSLTLSSTEPSKAHYDEPTRDGPIKRELSRITPGQLSRLFDSEDFKIAVDSDGPYIVGGRFKLN